MITLQKRVLEISYENKLSHIGSCLGVVGLLDDIYSIKNREDKVILSNGHAHLAHLVVREKYEGIDIKELLKFGIHCDRQAGCDASTGSLGQGLPIAVGMALADSERNVYCLISDGECAEGSIWEALRVASQLQLFNLHVYVIANGYSAYDKVNLDLLERRLKDFYPVKFIRVNTDLPFAKGLEPHYVIMSDNQFNELKNGF